LLIQQAKRLIKDEGKVFVEAASLVIPVILWSPMLYLFYLVFSIEMPVIPMAIYALLLIMGLPFLASGTRLWSMMLLCILALSLIRGHVSSKISNEQPYQANWTYYNNLETGTEKIILGRGVMSQVEKEYFPDAIEGKNGYEVSYAMNEKSPIIYTVERDSAITNRVLDRIKVQTNKDVIRLRLWGEVLAEAKVKIRGEEVTLTDSGTLQFLGNIKEEPIAIEIQRTLESKHGSFILETVQRGLIEKIAKNGTIIPGTGYTGGTIIHRHRIDI